MDRAAVAAAVLDGFNSAGDIVRSGVLRRAGVPVYSPATQTATATPVEVTCRVLWNGAVDTKDTDEVVKPGDLSVYLADCATPPEAQDVLVVDGVGYVVLRPPSDESAGCGALWKMVVR